MKHLSSGSILTGGGTRKASAGVGSKQAPAQGDLPDREATVCRDRSGGQQDPGLSLPRLDPNPDNYRPEESRHDRCVSPQCQGDRVDNYIT